MKKILLKILFVISLLIMSKALLLGSYPDFSNGYYYDSLRKIVLNYPPFITILFSVFLIFPLEIASKIWVILSISFVLYSLYLFLKVFKIKLSSSIALIVSSLTFVYFPLRFTLGMGQINALVLLSVVLTFYFYIKGKDAYSGTFLGISLMLKFFPVLLILFFLFKRKFNLILYSAITFIILGAIPYLFIKPEINNYYWLHVSEILGSVPVDYYNQALSGFLARSIDNFLLRDILRAVISILLIILSFWVIIKNKKKSFLIKTLGFGLIINLNVLVNGYAWQHHLVWLVLPYLITFFHILHKKLNIYYFIFLGASYLLTCINIKNFTDYPAIIQSHMFFGVLLLWGINMYLFLKND
jgi:hypothetical protein